MQQKKTFFTGIIVYSLMLMQCSGQNNYPPEMDKLVADAPLVIKAKIILLHTATTDETDMSNTGVVVVSEVIDAPEAFRNIAGQQVTVRFANINKVNVGDEKIFFTDPYWIGASLGVTEKASLGRSDNLFESKDMATLIKQARMKQDDEKLRRVLKESKITVTGKVVRITRPDAPPMIGSEHDPEWREAEIQIEETLKGKADGQTIKVLFSASKDVMFFDAPKFKQGDDGIFIIQQTDQQTIRLMKNENMLIEPSAFIRGRERVNHIKTLL